MNFDIFGVMKFWQKMSNNTEIFQWLINKNYWPGNIFISLHTRSVWETICDALPHSSYQIPVGKYFAQNFLSAHPQVFQECWSGVLPPPSPTENENLGRSWRFGFELLWSMMYLFGNLDIFNIFLTRVN